MPINISDYRASTRGDSDSTFVNRSAQSDTDSVVVPELIEVGSQTEVAESNRTVDLEQYVVIVIRGRRLFFRIRVILETQRRGVEIPHVDVEWDMRTSGVFIGSSPAIFVLCDRLRAGLARELGTALRHELPTDVDDTIMAELDLRSALAWRDTCRNTAVIAIRGLQSTLRRLLRVVVPEPQLILDALYAYRGVIGGELALAFVLRDADFPLHHVQIFVPAVWFPFMVDALHDSLEPHISSVVSIAGLGRAFRKTSDCVIMHLKQATLVVIWRSTTTSALSPISFAPCTALINFVTPFSFGCGYPDLTLNGEALIADNAILIPLPFDYISLSTLHKRGLEIVWAPNSLQRFTGRAHPTEASESPLVETDVDYVGFVTLYGGNTFPLPRFHPAWKVPIRSHLFMDTDLLPPMPCLGSHGLCPRRLRFFGDARSITEFMDPFSADRELLQDRCMPPFGGTVGWRLATTYKCDNRKGCEEAIVNPRLLSKRGLRLPGVPGKCVYAWLRPLVHWSMILYSLHLTEGLSIEDGM
ncbi:hypothetical protein C8Q76DRAFT_800997 [Earliella scabrosa]|nr:hypothetical protein C8Q76DRAFT_800997 [Earliella scabrosa]